MKHVRGDRLYVNLGASQVRRRLKGFGHGVRKVETAGRHQALIIHTATGQHLRELKGLFVDAMPSERQSDLGVPIENLRNLGPTSAAWLRDAGIHTREELARIGPVLAFQRMRQQQPRTSLNLLWALVAALEGRHWRDLSDDEKKNWAAEIHET